MLLLYIVPELFKRRPKKYEYPEIPQPVPESAPEPEAKPATVSNKGLTWALPQPMAKGSMPMSEVAPPMQVYHMQETGDNWQGSLSHASIINGLIFAEVLQPPRALRPFRFNQNRAGMEK